MRTLAFLLLLLSGRITAQTLTDVSGIPRLTLKTNISALLNPFKQALAFAADVRLAPRFSVNAGAGAIIGSPLQFAVHEGESYKGLRIRAGLKYYPIQKRFGAFYAGIEGKYHDIKHNRFRDVFRQGQQYVEILAVERNVKSRGVAACAGWQFFLGQNKRFLLEPYAGVGIIYHNVTFNLPPDAELIEQQEFISFELETGKTTTPDILLGLQIGLALW